MACGKTLELVRHLQIFALQQVPLVCLRPTPPLALSFKTNPLNMQNLYPFAPRSGGPPPSFRFSISDLFDFRPKDFSKKLKFITLAEAKDIYDKKKAVFVDAREHDYYLHGHIQNALNVPFQQIANREIQIPDTLKKNEHFVIYCGSETCPMSPKLAEYLLSQGFKHILVFSGGWDEWSKAGYPSISEAPKK
jgi:rhodanese-related sulfurtransferase